MWDSEDVIVFAFVGIALVVRLLSWEDDIEMNLQDDGGEAWTWLIWLRIGKSGGLLLAR
jgi:hypothetical protein